jgi:hypothetical protein
MRAVGDAIISSSLVGMIRTKTWLLFKEMIGAFFLFKL